MLPKSVGSPWGGSERAPGGEEEGSDPGATTSARLREIAREHPGRAAVCVDGVATTYGELDHRADELAARLLADLGSGDHCVGLRCSATLPMVLGALGIARAGMVSVPIDPTAPAERVRQVLEDVSSPLLLCDEVVDGDVGRPVGSPLDLRAPVPPGGVEREQGDLASIVFTSGSTGMPKGIMVPKAHRVGLLHKFSYLGDVGDGAHVGSLAAGTVGFSEGLVHGLVQAGATLEAYEIRRLGVTPLKDWLLQTRVFAFVTVPTVLRLLLSALPAEAIFPDLKMAVLTGETLMWPDVVALRSHLCPEAIVYNMFGLTETSAIALFKVTSGTPVGEGPLPAGWAVPSCRVSIVDEQGLPVATGERGEIVVSGEGCTLGYWKRPELTAKVFSVLPDGARQVRTGDAGRLNEDCLLEHLGRLDHVVKVAGNRVDLGDVEAGLRSLDGVFDAAAAAYTDAVGSTRLAGFVVPREGAALDRWVLRSALARRLPGPMVPDFLQVVDELPQLANGKVDRAILVGRVDQEAVPGAATDLERQIAGLWSAVLGRSDFGLDDNFFDLGGDSLRAARLFAEMERVLERKCPLAMILEAPTVRSLAASVGAGDEALGLLVPIAVNGSLPPLFVIHDGIGDIFYATRTAAGLGGDRPVYAVQPALALDGTSQEQSIEELAARYLRDVRRLRAHGPYLFYGFSLGGVIAFEMAVQLQKEGEEVSLLVLGDSSAPTLPLGQRFLARAAEVIALPSGQRGRRVAMLSGNFVRHSSTLVRERFSARHRDYGDTDKLEPWEEQGRNVMWTYGLLSRHYRPSTKYQGRVLLVRAGGASDRPDRGWGPMTSGEILPFDVDCTHTDLGKEPYAGMVAKAIYEAAETSVAGSTKH